jgi:O-antigen biosynthesis protein
MNRCDNWLDRLRDWRKRLASRLDAGRIFGAPTHPAETGFRVAKEPLSSQLRDNAQSALMPATYASVKPKADSQLESQLQVLQRSGLFDEQFYCESNPDIASAEISPLEHFLYVGAFEGRRPNPLFDPAYYLTIYPEVAKAGVNPAIHYLTIGALDGRDPSPEFDTSFYLAANPDAAGKSVNALVHFLRFGAREGRLRLPPERYQRDLLELQRYTAACRGQINLRYRPLLSVLMPTFNTPPIYLEAAVRSVMTQAYPNWELRIVDDGSSNVATLEALKRAAAWDERIFVVCNANNRGISRATNDALYAAHGEYVAMLDHDDELTVDALYEIVLALNSDPAVDVIYTDQDYVTPGGKPAGHFLKPDWSPTLFRGVMYVGHLLAVRRDLAVEVGGFDSRFDLIQDFEFMVRISERARKIHHVPKVLYHWRKIPESVAGGGKADRGIEQLQVAAVQAHLERLQLKGRARSNPRHAHRAFIELGAAELDCDFDLFLHGRAAAEAGSATIEDALNRTACQIARAAVPRSWFNVKIARNEILAVDIADATFSEADRLSKFLAESSAEFVLAVAADIAIETNCWIELLAVAAQEPDVAAACATVLSVDGLVAHAGLIMGSDGSVKPAMRGFDPEVDGYAGSLSCAREISAAWADVVLLRRSVIAPLLPPKPNYVTADFFVADLTLRATRSGLRVLCIPYVRGRRLATADADAERRLDALIQQDIWAGATLRDPFYNPNFVDSRGDYT